MLLITFLLGGKNPRRNSRVRRFPSKLKWGMEKANDPRSAILSPSYQLTFEVNDQKFPSKVFIFFLTPALIKSIQFFDPHDDVGGVRRRFSRENWTFVNNLRSQPLKVLFLPRINQI
jgi:hypothetical protein